MGAAVNSPATTSVRLVWPFVALARKHGYDVSQLAARLGLQAAQLRDPETRVPQHLVSRVLHDAIALSGERDIGLLAARYVDTEHFGITEYVARTRPTLGAALESTARYLPLLGDGTGYAVAREGNRVIARFWFSPELAMHEAAYEFAVAIFVLRARRMTRIEGLAPLAVHFMHARPASTARHDDLFRCPVHFGAEITHVIMSAGALKMSLPNAEPVLGDLLVRQAEGMLERLPRGEDVASRVRILLGGEVELRGASAERIAQRLGMSVRTLSRKLQDEGTSYRDLFDEVRERIALRELAQAARPIAEIAERLGFASPQSFHRAFKRWTGTTVHRYRKNARTML